MQAKEEADQEKAEASDDSKAQAALPALRAALEHAPRDFVANPAGKVTVTEFYDYRCPHCVNMAPTVLSIIHDNPNVRFVFKEFPIFGATSDTAAEGALPTLFAATSPQAKVGGYYGPNGFYELKGPPMPAKIMPQAKDTTAAARLWDVSAALTGVSFDPVAADAAQFDQVVRRGQGYQQSSIVAQHTAEFRGIHARGDGDVYSSTPRSVAETLRGSRRKYLSNEYPGRSR